jgi:hypothetical protein
LLRELLVLDEVDGRGAAQSTESYRNGPWCEMQPMSIALLMVRLQRQRQLESEEEPAGTGVGAATPPVLRAALHVCDAMFADWLTVRQQRVRERRVAVVAAVQAAVDAAAEQETCCVL